MFPFDHATVRVRETLDRLGIADNTIIVLWSDHGYHIGEKNTVQKQSLWERSSHVPPLIREPGKEWPYPAITGWQRASL